MLRCEARTGDTASIPETDLDRAVTLIAATAEAQDAPLSDESLQKVIAAIAKLYADRYQAGNRNAVVSPDALSATDTLIVVTALLKAANLELFELGMWQAWSGNR